MSQGRTAVEPRPGCPLGQNFGTAGKMPALLYGWLFHEVEDFEIAWLELTREIGGIPLIVFVCCHHRKGRVNREFG